MGRQAKSSLSHVRVRGYTSRQYHPVNGLYARQPNYRPSLPLGASVCLCKWTFNFTTFFNVDDRKQGQNAHKETVRTVESFNPIKHMVVKGQTQKLL